MSNTKNLHKHSLPILMLSVMAFVLSATSLSYHGSSASGVLTRSLTSSVIKIKPSKSGLAHIELNQQALHPLPAAPQTRVQAVPAAATTTVGESAKMQVLVNSIAATNK